MRIVFEENIIFPFLLFILFPRLVFIWTSDTLCSTRKELLQALTYFKLLTCSNAVISGKLGEILFSIMKSPIIHFAPIMYQVGICTIGMKSVNVRQCNRPFAGSGHTVLNKLHWDANNVVGLPKQRNSYQFSLPFLCFESPTALFAS